MTDRVINGGFETGDLTGWEWSEVGGFDESEAVVSNFNPYQGVYALWLYAFAYDGYVQLTQTIDFTGIPELSFARGINVDPETENPGIFEVYIGGNLKLSESFWVNSPYTLKTIDTSAISGNQEIKFKISCSWWWIGLWLDIVKAETPAFIPRFSPIWSLDICGTS